MPDVQIGWTDESPGECNERPIMLRMTGDGFGGETGTLRESTHHNGAALNAGGTQLWMRFSTLAIAEDSHGSFCSIGARKEYGYQVWFAACGARKAIRSS